MYSYQQAVDLTSLNSEYKYTSVEIDNNIDFFYNKEKKYYYLTKNELQLSIENVSKQKYKEVTLEVTCDNVNVLLPQHVCVPLVVLLVRRKHYPLNLNVLSSTWFNLIVQRWQLLNRSTWLLIFIIS